MPSSSKSKSKSKKQTNQISPHPQITELDTIEDLKQYMGIAKVPEISLVKQIEILQEESKRREKELGKKDKNKIRSTTSNNIKYEHEQLNKQQQQSSSSSSSQRYRKSYIRKENSFNNNNIDNNNNNKKIIMNDDSDEEYISNSDSSDDDDNNKQEGEDYFFDENGNKIKKISIKKPVTSKTRRNSDSNTNTTTTTSLEEEIESNILFSILDYTQLLIPLLSAHIILDILVRVQYAQDITWENVTEQLDILKRAAIAGPILITLHLFFDHWKFTRLFRIGSFLASVAIGTYLAYISNEEGYYFIMKRAPPLGTIWVWLIFEMHWAYAALSLVVVSTWMWLHGYSI